MLQLRLRTVWIWALRQLEAHPGAAIGVLGAEFLKDVLFSIFWDRAGPSMEAFIDRWTLPLLDTIAQKLLEFLLIPGSVFVLALIILIALSWWETRLPRPGPPIPASASSHGALPPNAFPSGQSQAPAAVQANEPSITGRVTSVGRPVVDACITLGPPIRCAATTKGDGSYSFDMTGAPNGIGWDVRVLMAGQIKGERLNVVVSGPTTVDFAI